MELSYKFKTKELAENYFYSLSSHYRERTYFSRCLNIVSFRIDLMSKCWADVIFEWHDKSISLTFDMKNPVIEDSVLIEEMLIISSTFMESADEYNKNLYYACDALNRNEQKFRTVFDFIFSATFNNSKMTMIKDFHESLSLNCNKDTEDEERILGSKE